MCERYFAFFSLTSEKKKKESFSRLLCVLFQTLYKRHIEPLVEFSYFDVKRLQIFCERWIHLLYYLFDPSDRFEDIVSLPNNIPDHIRHLQDCDTLVVLWTMYHENAVPYPHIHPSDNMLPPALPRYQGGFEANHADDRAWSIMMEHIDQVNREVENFVDDEELFNSISIELLENPVFPCANQYPNSNSRHDMAARSPRDEFSPTIPFL